ncbi:hypothetical protein [Alienimonas sp. DA493]|uniref:hypothetical protein n=1 Tax=Alienimonas sp. DA493 TaxID=3373605 RepID=UPI0037553D61
MPDRRDDRTADGHPEPLQPVGEFPVLLDRQAELFRRLDVLRRTVEQLAVAAEQSGDRFRRRVRLDPEDAGVQFVLLDLVDLYFGRSAAGEGASACRFADALPSRSV